MFIERIDACPVQNDDFSFEIDSWLTNLVSTLNEFVIAVESYINAPVLPQLTTAEIIAQSVNAQDSTMWYATDHIPPCPVMKVNGALVQLLTAPFP